MARVEKRNKRRADGKNEEKISENDRKMKKKIIHEKSWGNCDCK